MTNQEIQQMEHKLTFRKVFFGPDNDTFFEVAKEVEEDIYFYKDKYYAYRPEMFDIHPYEVKRTMSPKKPDIYWSFVDEVTNCM